MESITNDINDNFGRTNDNISQILLTVEKFGPKLRKNMLLQRIYLKTEPGHTHKIS